MRKTFPDHERLAGLVFTGFRGQPLNLGTHHLQIYITRERSCSFPAPFSQQLQTVNSPSHKLLTSFKPSSVHQTRLLL